MTLEEMRNYVHDQRPVLGALMEGWGHRTCLEYCNQTFEPLFDPHPAILSAFQRETEVIVGAEAAARAVAAVREKRWVDTTDHHGILHHPYFYTSALTRSHERVRPHSGTTVVLAFGSVSLSNDSFPRGFSFFDGDFTSRRFRLKTLRDRRLPVCALPPVSRVFFDAERDRMRTVPLAPTVRKRLFSLLDGIGSANQVWNQATYSAQISAINEVLWRIVCGPSRGELVYIELESVVRRALLEYHLLQDTSIHRLLFDQAWRDAYGALFEGIQGAHAQGRGTHFFWYIDHTQRVRRQLFLKDGALHTPEGDYVLNLAPESVAEALERRVLVPSSALSLLVVHGEGFLGCAGGFSQIQYLRDMMQQWELLLGSFGCAHPTPYPSIYSGEYAAFDLRRGEKRELPSFFDLFLYGPEDLNGFIDSQLERLTVRDSIDAMMPTLYWLLSRHHAVCEDVCPLASIEHYGT